jgi:hypothetical protein
MWTTRYRGVLAIHPGHRSDQDLQPWQRSIVAKLDAFARGAIIGVVELIDIVRHSTPSGAAWWRPDRGGACGQRRAGRRRSVCAGRALGVEEVAELLLSNQAPVGPAS